MKKIFSIAASVLFMSASAYAQSLTNPYDPNNAMPRCSPATSYGSGSVCDQDPLFEQFGTREVVVSAKFGQSGPEKLYIDVVNGENEAQRVIVEYAGVTSETTYFHRRTLGPNQRLSIPFHDDPLSTRATHFTVMVKFEKSGSSSLAWYRASDFTSLGDKEGKLMPKAAQ